MKSITGFASQSASTLYIAPDGEWRDTNYRSQARDSSLLGGMLDWVIGRRGRAAGAHVAAFTRADVLLEGRMLKLGAYVRSWKERYFILRADTRSLCYYDGQHSLQLLGEVVINKEASVAIESFPEPPGSTCLCVQCGVSKRKYYMRAADDATLTLWRDAIAAMIEPSENVLEHVAPPREEELEAPQHHDLLPAVAEKGEVEQVEEEEQEEQAEVAEAVAGGRAGRERTNWWWAIKEHMETEYEDAPMQVTLRLRQSQENLDTPFSGDVFVGVFFSRGRVGRSLGDSLNLLIRRKVLSRVATAESSMHQLDWSVMGRTENVRVGEDKLRGDQNTIVKNFSVLLRLPKSTTDLTLLFVLFAASSQDHEIEPNPAMAAVVIPFGTLKARLSVSKASSPSAVLPMVTVAAEDPVSAAASRGLEQALLALSPIRSPALHTLLHSTTHVYHTRPYARQYYCAHVPQGRLLACEELYLPVLAMAVPRAYIDLVSTERLELVRRIKEDLSEWLIASAEAGSMLMPMLRLLQELQMTIVDVYLECKAYYDACIQAADDASARRTGIHLPPGVNASTHRRSVLKKALHWQFVPINHNIQITYAALLPPETPEGGMPQRDTTAIMPTVTLGLCTAHPLGFSQGGLRSLLSASGLGSASTRFGQDALQDVLTFDVLRTLRHEFLSAVQARMTVTPLLPATANERSPSSLEDDDEHSKRLHSLPSYRLLRQSLRADSVCCQCLSMAICSLTTLVNMAVVSARHRVILARAVHGAGYLVGVESLLSTALKESGMIEDMSMAVGWLNTVTVRLTTAKPPPPEEPLIDLYGDGQPDLQATPTAALPSSPAHTPAPTSPSHTREEQHVGRAVDGVAVWRRQTDKHLVVDVSVSPEAADVLRGIIAEYRSCSPRATAAVEPGEQRVDGDVEVLTVVPLTGVLFTQGINELQTISNNFSRSTLQQEINAAALDVLDRYTRRYIEVIDKLESSGDLLGGEKAELLHLLSQCREAFTDRSIAKNVGVLLAGSDLCRALVGVVSVGCKSGKDRTAMALALEQTRFLCQNYGIPDGVQLCQTIRKHGVRRTNVFANTGHPAYAFSSITQERLTIFPRVIAPRPERTVARR